MKANLRPNHIGTILGGAYKIYDFPSFFNYIINDEKMSNYTIIVTNSFEDFYVKMIELLKNNSDMKCIVIKNYKYEDIKEFSIGTIYKHKDECNISHYFKSDETVLVNNFQNKPILDVQLKRYSEQVEKYTEGDDEIKINL